MKIYGLSQTSGVERRLFLERAGDGLVLIITDHEGNRERARIMVPADAVVGAIMDPAPGGTSVEGIAPPNGPKMHLEIEVRRNEVLLAARTDTEATADVAVGLDDLQDALERIIGQG
jgi:hypothetical protein